MERSGLRTRDLADTAARAGALEFQRGLYDPHHSRVNLRLGLDLAVAKPGVALRALRDRHRWTLADVTDRTGIPASTLSRIENDQVSPTYDMLMKLSNGLKIDLAELLSMGGNAVQPPAEQSGRRSINFLGEGQTIDLRNHTLRYLSNDLLEKQVTPIFCEYRASSLEEFGDFMRHPGEEFLFILEGELELHSECYAPTVLKAGESIYFDSRMGHAYVARVQPCRALSICTVPRDTALFPRQGDRDVAMRG